jgi:UDP-N-acetylmuramoyl-tripeptide--D-alanyl-D-alanine ligase
LVLGDMAELGGDTRALHASIGRHAQARGIDRLFAVGPLSAATVQAFGAGATHFNDQSALIDALRAQLHAGVTCLIKGSRSAAMERVVAALTHDNNHKGTATDVA